MQVYISTSGIWSLLMNIVVDLLKISQTSGDKIDFNTLIFKIELPQRVDIDQSKDLWIFLKTLISGGALKIFIDLKNLAYIDSSGIGVLINAAKLVRKDKGDIILANVSGEIKNIFKVINLENFIKVYNSEVDAVNSYRYL
jgi:anti-sigma B factor antagonist